jgi:hypothetical protein
MDLSTSIVQRVLRIPSDLAQSDIALAAVCAKQSLRRSKEL